MDTKEKPSDDSEQVVEAVQEIGNITRASWPFSLDTIQQAISRYSPRAKKALISAFLWCTDPLHPFAKPDFAERVQSSDNTLYKIYTGTYRWPKVIIERDGKGKEIARKPHPKADQQIQPSDDLIKSIENFLSLERKRFEMGETQLVITPTLQAIVDLCNLARESQTIAFLVGPSHIGKTWALERHYQPSNNHGSTIYTRMEAASGLGGMVRAMAKSLSISDKGNTTNMIRRIKNAVTPDMLWILDEVHLLAHTYRKGSFHNCMEVIREIHDVKKLGFVLSFTILDEIKAASQKELQQLWRRGVHKLILPNMPTVEDLTAILTHNGLEFPSKDLEATYRYKDDDGKWQSTTDKPRALLRQVAKDEALLAVTERLRYARKLAKKSGKPVDWDYFIGAHYSIAAQSKPADDWI